MREWGAEVASRGAGRQRSRGGAQKMDTTWPLLGTPLLVSSTAMYLRGVGRPGRRAFSQFVGGLEWQRSGKGSTGIGTKHAAVHN